MKQEEKESRRKEVCEFRYSLIAELANPYLGRGELNALIREKALREYEIPCSGKSTITEACIRRWLFLYRKYGKDGLLPKVRSDAGASRRLSSYETSLILDYLESHPRLTDRKSTRLNSSH